MSNNKSFIDNSLQLCEKVKAWIKEAPDSQAKLTPLMLDFLITVIESSDTTNLIDGFISKSYPHWDRILAKDEKFMIENSDVLFGDIGKNKVDAIVKLYTLTQDKSETWSIVHDMVKCSIRHIHTVRFPIKEGDGVRYTISFFPNIKLKACAEKWNVKL